MKKLVFISLIIVIISVPFSLLSAGSKWEYWNSYKVSLHYNKNLVISVAPEFRFNNCWNNYYTHIDMSVELRVRKWIRFSANYRHIFTQKNNDWDSEYRPNVDLKFIYNSNIYSISNRSKMELRIRNNDESFRYRNQTCIKLPTITKLFIRPYCAEEFFYDLEADRINRNRIYTGVEFPLKHKLGVIASYILESNKEEFNWQNTSILKIDLKYNIN